MTATTPSSVAVAELLVAAIQAGGVKGVKRIAAAVQVPIIAGVETGYGNENNIARTVAVYESAGVAALHIEGQEWPKRCGFMEGKRVIPKDDMASKIEAAAGRSNPGHVIIGRTDALAPNGWDDALARASFRSPSTGTSTLLSHLFRVC